MGTRRKGILIFTTHQLLARVAAVGQGAHGLVGERVPQAVVGHVVDDRHVAVLVAGPGVGQQVRSLGHRFHAAGDDNLAFTRPDQLISKRYRIEPGQTHLVDCQGGHRHWDAGLLRQPAERESGQFPPAAPGP